MPGFVLEVRIRMGTVFVFGLSEWLYVSRTWGIFPWRNLRKRSHVWVFTTYVYRSVKK